MGSLLYKSFYGNKYRVRKIVLNWSKWHKLSFLTSVVASLCLGGKGSSIFSTLSRAYKTCAGGWGGGGRGSKVDVRFF